MSTPRNFDVPAFKMLGALYPNIDVKNQNDPDFIKAEKALADAQFEAMTIVRTQPGINNVRWELDVSWLRSHSIDVPDNALPRNR
jgi:DNA topoisomerase VI subunit A